MIRNGKHVTGGTYPFNLAPNSLVLGIIVLSTQISDLRLRPSVKVFMASNTQTLRLGRNQNPKPQAVPLVARHTGILQDQLRR